MVGVISPNGQPHAGRATRELPVGGRVAALGPEFPVRASCDGWWKARETDPLKVDKAYRLVLAPMNGNALELGATLHAIPPAAGFRTGHEDA